MVQLKDLATQAAPLQDVWFSFPCFTVHEEKPTFHVLAMHFYNDREYLGKIQRQRDEGSLSHPGIITICLG